MAKKAFVHSDNRRLGVGARRGNAFSVVSETSSAFREAARSVGSVPVIKVSSAKKRKSNPYAVQTGCWFANTKLTKVSKTDLYL